MRVKQFLYLLVLFTTLVNATLYEDAEDGNTDGWSIYDNNPSGATITNLADDGGRVIKFQGSSRRNGYMLGSIYQESKKWHDTENNSIAWRMNFDENFVVYLSVETAHGHRYIAYTSKTGYHRINGEYITLSLGGEPINHGWVSFVRNLQEDIYEFEPNNELISIDAFLVRGSGLIDDIETKNLSINQNPISHIYDIGGNIGAWKIYDSDPSGATVTSVEANYHRYTGQPIGTTHHTKLNGTARKNGYILGALWGDGKWNNTTDSIVTWRMKFEDNFVVYVSIKTKFGHRYVTYTSKGGYYTQRGEYIILSLGGRPINNDWVNFSKDIEHDLHLFEPDNELIALDAFLVRGSGLIDNVITYHNDQASLLLADSDRYNHTEQYSRDYAQLKTLEATDLVYLYSSGSPRGAIDFYTIDSNGTLNKKNSSIYTVNSRWDPMYNIEPLSPSYITTANIWTLDNGDCCAPHDDGVPSDGSYLLVRYRTDPFEHMVVWKWYDISNLDNIQLVEQTVYESY